MKSSYWLGAIALCGLQIAMVQNTSIAATDISQVAKDTSVRLVAKNSGTPEYSGVLIAKAQNLYTVLVVGEGYQKTQVILTHDGQKHPITKIRSKNSQNGFSYTILQFRSRKNYRVVKIGAGRTVAMNSEIYVTGGTHSNIQTERNRLVLNQKDVLLFARQQSSYLPEKRFILNDQGELIGLHLRDGWSIDNEGMWSENSLSPTIPNLERWYRRSPCQMCGTGEALRQAQFFTVRNRYNQGISIDNLNLSQQKQGISVSHQPIQSASTTEADRLLSAALGEIELRYNGVNTIVAFDRAIMANPNNSDLYAFRANAKWYNDRVSGSEQASMLADYDRALQLNPQDSLSLFLRSRLRIKSKDLQGALADINRLIALNPSSPNGYYYRAYLRQHELKDFAGALSDYDRVVAGDRSNPNVYLLRGFLKEDGLQDYQGALLDYNQLIELDGSVFLYQFLAQFKENKLKDFAAALKDYDRVVKMDPENPVVLRKRAQFKANRLQDLPGALADYNATILRDNSVCYHTDYQERAMIRAKLKDLAGALADYDFIIDQQNLPQDYQLRGNFKIDFLGDRSGALQDHNRAVEIASESSWSASIYYARGLFKATKLQDRPGAIADFQQALQNLKKIESERGELQSEDRALLGKIQAALHQYQPS
jgi:tetratricopeptide (TPR) repeat protein